jgi:hypothetical protein
MGTPYLLIDPQESLDFAHDWSDFVVEGDGISSRQWTISPLNAGSPTTPMLVNATSDAVFVTGCQAGQVYRLTESILTSAGLRADRSIVLRCEDQ